MTARQQWTIVGVVVLALAVGLWIMSRALGDELFPVAVGSDAPSFAAVTLDAPPREVSLDEYEGEVVLLNIWATWCAPCREEMPSIQQLHERFGDRGLHVMAVSIDNPGMEQAIRDFAGEYDLTFQILHDPGNRISTSYQVTGYPETFLIDQEGVIRKKVIGATDWFSPSNQALIASLLGDTTDVARPDAPESSTVPVAR